MKSMLIASIRGIAHALWQLVRGWWLVDRIRVPRSQRAKRDE